MNEEIQEDDLESEKIEVESNVIPDKDLHSKMKDRIGTEMNVELITLKTSFRKETKIQLKL